MGKRYNCVYDENNSVPSGRRGDLSAASPDGPTNNYISAGETGKIYYEYKTKRVVKVF